MTRDANTSFHSGLFGALAEKAASWAGRPIAFGLAVIFIVIWALTGPFFHYSSLWKMTIEVAPTLVTFLLVFLIQNSQNRETLAVQLKLNELIRATEGAHTMMLSLEKLTEQELKILCERYEKLAHEARSRLQRGETDQDAPDIPLPQDVPPDAAEILVTEEIA